MTNATADDIRQMILRASSDESRAMLLILQQMSESIVASNASWAGLANKFGAHQERFEQHLKTFEQHAEQEMALINKGIGFWRAVAIVGPMVLSVIGGMGMWNISQHLQVLTRETAVNEAQAVDIAALRARIETLAATVERNTTIINARLIGLAAGAR